MSRRRGGRRRGEPGLRVNGVIQRVTSACANTRAVSSSSESDSDGSSQASRKAPAVERETRVRSCNSEKKLYLTRKKENSPVPSAAPTLVKKEKKNKKYKTSSSSVEPDQDVPMEDAPASTPAKPTSKANAQKQDDFSAIYLRKVAAEFADDLDKVREAQDFKASSVPMLIHALKQGESLFTVEERRRVVGAAKA